MYTDDVKLHGPTEEIVEIFSDDEGVTPTSYGYLIMGYIRLTIVASIL